MKSFVISLPSAHERRSHITEEFHAKKIDFEFFDALTPDLAYEIIKSDFDFFDLTKISEGELACALSHITVWKKALNDGLDYVAIFEDDIFLTENASLFLKDSSWLEQNIDILKIETFFERVILKKSKLSKEKHVISELKTDHFGAAGYILSKKAIKNILNYIQHLTTLKPLDHILFSDLLKHNDYIVYQLEPAICIQEKVLKQEITLVSSLDAFRNNFKVPKQMLSIDQKIKREFLRLIHKLRLCLFARKVEFK
ncbi:glycosyltransferase family 25 protein [Acinetobacter sp. DSM 11652]|uniref:glycosyltransferase family 25 protein n=1 Tax=Acinetobacter sp. DSM 11652 TaxID=346222 RepID=UPI0008B7EDB3|nr:glycosyltransferase family 25 protein [Acinetobacter sp. DSM 11652]SEM01954.1 glycosyl transferase, family 25 [Acinetobacter sp. DSM 11652]